jgi:hypothetical protein
MAADNLAVPLRNSYCVIPARFLATEHPRDLSAEGTQRRCLALLHAGLRTFIDLTEEDEMFGDADAGGGYRRHLQKLARDRHFEVNCVRFPIPDRTVPSLWTMRSILELIDLSIHDKNPVLVHCWAGIGRTGTVVGCFLKRHGLATSENVLDEIGKLRQSMPGGREPSPHTPEQVRMVRNWKKGV